MMQHEIVDLKDVAEVTAGYPIRGSVSDMPSGDVAVVQLKNVTSDTAVDWSSVIRTRLEGRRDPDWLKPGDVIFSARGYRNVAALIESPPARAVCSPHFFLLRVKRTGSVLPEFIAWQINQPDAQRYLAQSAEGSNIPSIRRQVLEQMPVRLPSMERQRTLARLGQTARREKELLERLIKNRERELDLVARDLFA
jgi:hypothetical protein